MSKQKKQVLWWWGTIHMAPICERELHLFVLKFCTLYIYIYEFPGQICTFQSSVVMINITKLLLIQFLKNYNYAKVFPETDIKIL